MDTTPKPPRLELALSLTLIPLSILVWLGFISFLQTTFAERAAFHFMVSHLQLGETPEFVLQIAGEGLPQPFEILYGRREFWASLAVLVFFDAALSWLATRLWRMNRTRKSQEFL